MATFKSFEDIEAWKKARELTMAVYTISRQDLFARDFGLRDQIRRASVSIMANIAEGYERGGTKEFSQFLSIAKGSVGELKAHLYVALDQQYFTKEHFDRLFGVATDIARLLGGLMNYLHRSRLKGTKFKPTNINSELETRNSKLT